MATTSATVYLVGAGPGDYGLVTYKAIQCLKKADVVVYDHLADPRILAWAPETAEKIYVGKISAHHTMKQEGISHLLADKAKEGKTVVRLKGGDPFVFGRGGEEGIVLREAGVPFEIVPGVTSAISVPAYAGIPVTHRAIARSFAVVTGHKDPTTEGDVNWEKLATATDTIVFLMGIANLPHITEQLVKYGRPADTPAAVIRETRAARPHDDGRHGGGRRRQKRPEASRHLHRRRSREAQGPARLVRPSRAAPALRQARSRHACPCTGLEAHDGA